MGTAVAGMTTNNSHEFEPCTGLGGKELELLLEDEYEDELEDEELELLLEDESTCIS